MTRFLPKLAMVAATFMIVGSSVPALAGYNDYGSGSHNYGDEWYNNGSWWYMDSSGNYWCYQNGQWQQEYNNTYNNVDNSYSGSNYSSSYNNNGYSYPGGYQYMNMNNPIYVTTNSSDVQNYWRMRLYQNQNGYLPSNAYARNMQFVDKDNHNNRFILSNSGESPVIIRATVYLDRDDFNNLYNRMHQHPGYGNMSLDSGNHRISYDNGYGSSWDMGYSSSGFSIY